MGNSGTIVTLNVTESAMSSEVAVSFPPPPGLMSLIFIATGPV